MLNCQYCGNPFKNERTLKCHIDTAQYCKRYRSLVSAVINKITTDPKFFALIADTVDKKRGVTKPALVVSYSQEDLDAIEKLEAKAEQQIADTDKYLADLHSDPEYIQLMKEPESRTPEQQREIDRRIALIEEDAKDELAEIEDFDRQAEALLERRINDSSTI